MPYVFSRENTQIFIADLQPKKPSFDVGKSPEKNPAQAHLVEKSIFPPNDNTQVCPLWVEKSPNSLYLGECLIFHVSFRLQKKSDGWTCMVKIGYEKFFGFSRNSKESALFTTWTSAKIERERHARNIPHTLNWGVFNHEIPQSDNVYRALQDAMPTTPPDKFILPEPDKVSVSANVAKAHAFSQTNYMNPRTPRHIHTAQHTDFSLKLAEDTWKADREESNSNRI